MYTYDRKLEEVMRKSIADNDGPLSYNGFGDCAAGS
jgi:hypothetical protein